MRVHPQKTRANFAHTITITNTTNIGVEPLRIEKAELEVGDVRMDG
jgi:hypothetical protein